MRSTLPFLSILLFACGCGSSTYEARMGHTQKYFRYQARLSEGLQQAAWSGSGITLRVPKPFIATNETLDAEKQPRQPFFLSTKIPGLVAVWEAKVPASVGGNKAVEVPAYCLAFSNYSLLGDDDGDALGRPKKKLIINPKKYNEEIINLIDEDSYTTRPEGRFTMDQKQIPSKKPAFTRIKQFYVVSESARMNLVNAGGIPKHFNGREMGITMYQIENGQVHLTLMFILPRTLHPSLKMGERIEYALETLSLASSPPGPGKPNVGGGGKVGPGPDI